MNGWKSQKLAVLKQFDFSSCFFCGIKIFSLRSAPDAAVSPSPPAAYCRALNCMALADALLDLGRLVCDIGGWIVMLFVL